MKKLITILALTFCALLSNAQKPNFIIIFTDDQGYADLSSFGAEGFETPNIDRLADNGLSLKSFYVSSSLCTPSRAGLQTGKYHARVRLFDRAKGGGVYFPFHAYGMNPDEITIAKALKPAGYKSALIGKWHLGHKEGDLPHNVGYDYFYGIPYSNDMWLFKNAVFAKDCVFRNGATRENANSRASKEYKNDVPLMKNGEVIQYPANQDLTTQRYFEEAIQFIDENKDSSFYVCITPSMPHYPLAVSEKFKGKTKRGLYGDVIEEIDFNTGKLVDYLKKNNLFENTIIVFTSDNGPWLQMKEYGGCAKPLKWGKNSLAEGGMRVPCVISYPAKFKKGDVSYEIISTLDLLPTFASLAGAQIPDGLDGLDMSKFFTNQTKETGRNIFYFYDTDSQVQGVRKGDYKLIIKPKKDEAQPFALYNLAKDISEAKDIINEEPEVLAELTMLMQEQKKVPTPNVKNKVISKN